MPQRAQKGVRHESLGLKQSDAILVRLTPVSNGTTWLLHEGGLAVAQNKKAAPVRCSPGGSMAGRWPLRSVRSEHTENVDYGE